MPYDLKKDYKELVRMFGKKEADHAMCGMLKTSKGKLTRK